MKLEELFANVLRVAVAELSENSSPNSVPNWDSLRHIELIMSAEAQYGVRFSNAEVTTIRTLGCLRQLLHSKGIVA